MILRVRARIAIAAAIPFSPGFQARNSRSRRDKRRSTSLGSATKYLALVRLAAPTRTVICPLSPANTASSESSSPM